jgi:uncharacterized protein (TIGR02449 family)
MQDTDAISLNQLEEQIDQLLKETEHLRTTNNSLRNRLAQSIRKRTELEEKNHHASEKVKHIITNLKEETA